MKHKPPIPVYHLHERTNRSFQLLSLDRYPDISHWDQAHRDDNYLLLFQQSGSSIVMVDFQEITIAGCAIYCILPGQVHYGVSTGNTTAWVLALDPTCIKEVFRTVLASFAIMNKAVPLPPSKGELFSQSFSLLKQLDEQSEMTIENQPVFSMLEVCIGLFVAACQGDRSLIAPSALRPQLITRQFRTLLLLNFRDMKSPAEYAAALNISPSYLNEVVKDTTGHPVSYWIHQEIMLEAKRMLFYTNSTVKEISHLLGYADTTYFIRLFSKIAGMPPSNSGAITANSPDLPRDASLTRPTCLPTFVLFKTRQKNGRKSTQKQ
ncbi:AraC family transcriptional regulator [Paraflavitalea speifideaquila]|uniref:AraC family transcriptional regulator n=1 Tax=Paraflavitalea speifideaquila TaxID=3076558 RepID=UPI0028E2E345|nr:AraC family transcriptional regulator [Paraflavitalea speifideiaquila]